ncbi:DUF4435 domain-containing protein [Acinetobacter pittii]|uniref:DUF4435 domain-containing protein n=1 Tax=Acinetobacter pittii TaxID=48296 RepID=UPI003260F346
MSSLIPSIEEFITEIVSLSNDKRPWLIVEGESDILFFEQRFSTKYSISLEERRGWEGVTKLMEHWNKLSIADRKGKILLGVIDKDFHDFMDTPIPENVIMVDHRDIEIMMFENDEALHKVLLEFGSKDKLPIIQDKVNLAEVRKCIYELALPLTKLRLANALIPDVNLSFEKPFNFKGIVDLRPLTLKLPDLINKLSIHNRCSKESIYQVFSNELVSKSYPYNMISNGHDVICLLGKSLQKHFGSVSEAKLVEGDKLEGHFRLSFPNNDFESSNFGRKILFQLGLVPAEAEAA